MEITGHFLSRYKLRQGARSHLVCLTFCSVIFFYLHGLTDCTLAYADPKLSTLPKALSPVVSKTLNGSVDDWRKRAAAWYNTDDIKSRRRQMRDMSRPLKQACYYCHTRNFKEYVESTYLISLQMMAISAEQGLACKDCHIGQRALNALGAKSLIQWRYAVEQQKDCADCHEPKGQFKRLTAEGKQSLAALMSDLQTSKKTYEVSSKVTKDFLNQLTNLKKKLKQESIEQEAFSSPP